MNLIKRVWAAFKCFLQTMFGDKCVQDEHEELYNYR